MDTEIIDGEIIGGEIIGGEIIGGEIIGDHPGRMHIQQPYEEPTGTVSPGYHGQFPIPAPPVAPEMDELDDAFEKPVPTKPTQEQQGALLIIPDAPQALQSGWEKTKY